MIFLSIKKPNNLIKINKIGGSAKFVKKAVAPASLKGSFFLKSKKAFLKWIVNKCTLMIVVLNMPFKLQKIRKYLNFSDL